MFVVNVLPMLLLGMVTAARIAVVAALKTLEVVGMLLIFAMVGICAAIAKAGIEAPIHMPVKAIALIPGTCTHKPTACEPLRTVVAVWSAAVGTISVIAVWASWSNADADANGNLRLRLLRSRCCAEKSES